MPTIKEMLEYLMDHNFTQDQEITFLVEDPQKRLVCHPTKLIGITDQKRPIIFLEVGEPEDMDGDEVEESVGLTDGTLQDPTARFPRETSPGDI
jgi:hypothetical protein